MFGSLFSWLKGSFRARQAHGGDDLPQQHAQNPRGEKKRLPVTGTVRQIRSRQAPAAPNRRPKVIWNLRIERVGKIGEMLEPVAVEMRANKFTGGLVNGDQVAIKRGKWRNGTLHTRKIINQSTGAHFIAKRPFWHYLFVSVRSAQTGQL